MEPEFAGLWEKRSVLKPAGDAAVSAGKTPRAKTCKASKMEQVCFFTNLYAVGYSLSVGSLLRSLVALLHQNITVFFHIVFSSLFTFLNNYVKRMYVCMYNCADSNTNQNNISAYFYVFPLMV